MSEEVARGPSRDLDPTHRQQGHRVRFEWGPVAATALTPVDLMVVVDVLSFTTTLAVALERGIEVVPFGWRDERAAAAAEQQEAVLAVGRGKIPPGVPGVSLSPAAVAGVEGVRRILLPSPNGSSICAAAAGTGAVVVGACLRNRAAVARWLVPQLQAGATLAVVACGERWPDGTLRPAVEDLWGAGAVLAAVAGALGPPAVTGFSPEAEMAAAAFAAVADEVPDRLAACGSGLELGARGYAVDVEAAARLDVSEVVPVLRDGCFVLG